MRILATLALLALTAGFATGQTASYSTFGTGCKGSNNKTVVLVNVGVPRIGNSFTIEVRNAIPNTAAGLITGASKTKWLIANLPMDLTIFGAPGCFLYVSFDTLAATPVNGSGVGSLTATLPNSAALLGIVFHQQYLILDLQANTLGFVWTGGGTGTIGT